jgi:hypothetical protein
VTEGERSPQGPTPQKEERTEKNGDLDEILMELWKYTGDKMRTLF